jgi:hypothetical protein
MDDTTQQNAALVEEAAAAAAAMQAQSDALARVVSVFMLDDTSATDAVLEPVPALRDIATKRLLHAQPA